MDTGIYYILLIFIGMCLIGFVLWCCSKAAKDPLFNEDMDNMQDHAQFIDTVEMERPNIVKKQAS